MIGLVTVTGPDETIDDDEAHGVQDAVRGVRDETRKVDDEQDLESRTVDGAHVVLNGYLNHPSRLCFLGDEKIIRPIAGDWDALSRGWSRYPRYQVWFIRVALMSLQIGFLPQIRPSISTLHAIVIMREPQCGSLRATPTEGGKNPVL